ncbi:translocase SEC61 complex gamma subunit [Sodiomyces alkalinus F11]|uniref:Translocase SEC61 complex gamma subunit n=1 Tax=Sodiomyces alkalinus (strain CBS 110278 / VKM F-3762 / F11) TaxID=1314773 RepID=A0A3N2PT52_SODAK|nr:translocase SEC61 complex gamma subunit [Sodiomyces alkalinus F11]ROT37661.1 translocase SEC61 complex gamma subunit [Sodiomyces alkalinus F11]
MADSIKEILEIPTEFAQDGIQFMRRCTKPDRAEYQRLVQAVGVGFLVMGAVGYVVRLIHYPVNNILVGGA